MQKFLASLQFQWDRQLYDAARDQPAQCHTSDINEELGLVTHLFSDKTGTLTRNEMLFKMWVKDGVVFSVEEVLLFLKTPFNLIFFVDKRRRETEVELGYFQHDPLSLSLSSGESVGTRVDLIMTILGIRRTVCCFKSR